MSILSGFIDLLLFLPFFILLFILGTLKAVIIGLVAALVITVGNSAVIIGLWPAHAIWTYYCLAWTKQLGPILKAVILGGLIVPIILCPVMVILGTILLGLGYGLGAPLVATFEAVGAGREKKFVHCFVDGTWSTVKGSCTVVRDFTDVCVYSYFSFMNELREQPPKDGKPLDINLLQLPGCILAGLLGVILDVPIITLLAIWKAPYMLLKGWHQLFHDLIGREGPFLETACVPFAGLSILLWPLAVTGAVVAAFLSSFFLGLYGAVIVYREDSVQLGLNYILSAIALFDEYSNDCLDMREGSCFPRLEYKHKSSFEPPQACCSPENQRLDSSNKAGKHTPEHTKTLKKALQELKSVQIWDRLFHSCEFYGRALVQEGVIRLSDLEDWISTGKSRILTVGLPAYSILQSLLHSAKFDSLDFLLSDGGEVTKSGRAEDRLMEWFFQPLMIMKEQIRAYRLEEIQALYLSKLVIVGNSPERMESWQNGGIPPNDEVKRAELEALSRRLQGIANSISRMPTFRRRFQNVVKGLREAATETDSSNVCKLKSTPKKDGCQPNAKAKNKLGKKQARNQCDDNYV